MPSPITIDHPHEVDPFIYAHSAPTPIHLIYGFLHGPEDAYRYDGLTREFETKGLEVIQHPWGDDRLYSVQKAQVKTAIVEHSRRNHYQKFIISGFSMAGKLALDLAAEIEEDNDPMVAPSLVGGIFMSHSPYQGRSFEDMKRHLHLALWETDYQSFPDKVKADLENHTKMRITTKPAMFISGQKEMFFIPQAVAEGLMLMPDNSIQHIAKHAEHNISDPSYIQTVARHAAELALLGKHALESEWDYTYWFDPDMEYLDLRWSNNSGMQIAFANNGCVALKSSKGPRRAILMSPWTWNCFRAGLLNDDFTLDKFGSGITE